MAPTARQMKLPPGYGNPRKVLEWSDVARELEEAPQYWVASVRPDGRPHVVPRDGIWLDDAWYYGGSDDTVHNRNLETNRALTMHVGDGMKAIIVEGTAEKVAPPEDVAVRLAEASNRKYAHYGMNATAASYTAGVWALKPSRVLAWNALYEDATRFDFTETGSAQ